MAAMEEVHAESDDSVDEEDILDSFENGYEDDDEDEDMPMIRSEKKFRKDEIGAKKRGVCYLSRIPPHMCPTKLRQILSQYGDIQRIYLTPEDPMAQVKRKRAGGFRGQQFSEGWVEFAKKSVAKRVANMLNGEQIGGKRRSSFYYDIWNIRYLSKFTWDDLTSEIAEKNHIREQKRTMEASVAKRERDFYLSKVDQSRALNSIEERRKKKQKTEEPESHAEEPKFIRQFRQNRPVSDAAVQKKTRLSKEVLAELLGGGS